MLNKEIIERRLLYHELKVKEHKAMLSKIKDEPISPEEWVDKRFGIDTDNPFRVRETRIEIFSAGATENEKKHLLRQTLPEASIEFNHRQMYTSNDMYCFRQGWKAHAKATNTEA